MRRVILESPYAGDIITHLIYARRAMRDSLDRGEAPFLSHLLYTQTLMDEDPIQRERGIDAGMDWMRVSEATVVYTDYGISRGMSYGIGQAKALGHTIEYREIGKNEVHRDGFTDTDLPHE